MVNQTVVLLMKCVQAKKNATEESGKNLYLFVAFFLTNSIASNPPFLKLRQALMRCTATPLCGGKIHRPASQSFMSFTKLPYNEAIDLISFLSACWLSRKAGAWTVGPAADNMPINEIRFPASCFRVREQALVHRPQRGNFVNRLVSSNCCGPQ